MTTIGKGNPSYPLLAEYADKQILYQDRQTLLFRMPDGIRLHRAGRYRGAIVEHMYLFDDLPFVIATLIDVLHRADEGQCFVSTKLEIRDANGDEYGDLRNTVIAAYIRRDVKMLSVLRIREANKALVDGAHDWRLRNMHCPPLNGLAPGIYCKCEVEVNGDEIDLIYNGVVTLLDNTPDMLRLLRTHTLHPEGRGNGRIVVEVKGRSVYLYRLVLAGSMYGGIPETDDEILAMMERFRRETVGYHVDHLNGVAEDCGLRNLMLLLPRDNLRKQSLQNALNKYRKYYAEAERYDDTHVRYREGHRDEGGRIVTDSDAVLGVDEYMAALSAFASKIRIEERKEKTNG